MEGDAYAAAYAKALKVGVQSHADILEAAWNGSGPLTPAIITVDAELSHLQVYPFGGKGKCNPGGRERSVDPLNPNALHSHLPSFVLVTCVFVSCMHALYLKDTFNVSACLSASLSGTTPYLAVFGWPYFAVHFAYSFRCIEFIGGTYDGSGTVTYDLRRVVLIIYRKNYLSAAWTLRLFATACVIVIFILLILFVVVRVVLQRPQTCRGSVALIRASHFAHRVSDEVAVR